MPAKLYSFIATLVCLSLVGREAGAQNFGLAPSPRGSVVNLSITKDDGLAQAVAGSSHTYYITVANAGADTATGAVVTDIFPPAMSNVAWTATFAGGASGNASGTGDISEMVDLPAGSSIAYVATGEIDLLASGTLANTATVAAPVGATDSDPSDNSATDSNPLVSPPCPVVYTENFNSASLGASPSTLGFAVENLSGLDGPPNPCGGFGLDFSNWLIGTDADFGFCLPPGPTTGFTTQYALQAFDDNDPNDDWMITPNIALTGGRRYIVSYQLATPASKPSDMEVWMGQGQTSGDMVAGAMLANHVDFGGFTAASAIFNAPSDGAFNLGFREHSAPASPMLGYTGIDNIAVCNATPAELFISPPSLVASVPQTIVLEIRLNANGQPVRRVAPFVAYDTAALRFCGGETNVAVFGGAQTEDPEEDEPGVVSFPAEGSANVTGNDVLVATLRFVATGQGSSQARFLENAVSGRFTVLLDQFDQRVLSNATGAVVDVSGRLSEPAFGLNAALSGTFDTFALSDSASPATALAPAPPGAMFSGGDFAGLDFSTFYAWNATTNSLTEFDASTGMVSMAHPPAAPTPGEVWSGLAWDHSTGTMYATAANLGATSSSLYTVNLTNGQATLVGPIGAGGFGGSPPRACVALAAHPISGELYAAGFDSSLPVGDRARLIRINKADAEPTTLGPGLAIEPTLLQDLDFDDQTGGLYWAAALPSGDSELREIDIATGTALCPLAPIGMMGAGNRYGAWAIASGNQAPEVADIVDQSTGTGNPVMGLAFIVDEGQDREEDFQSLSIVATSDNQQLLPDANIVVNYMPDGPGDATGGTIDLSPDPRFYGQATVTVTAMDDGFMPAMGQDTFVLTVEPPAACVCFPSMDPSEGKFVALAGSNLGSLDNTSLLFSIGVPFNFPQFELSIFDGDSGRSNGSMASPPMPSDWVGGRADFGTAETEFLLYADPAKSGAPSGLGAPLATFLSNGMNVPGAGGVPANYMVSSPTMPDGAPFDIVAPVDPAARNANGNYFYLLEVRFQNQGAAADALQLFHLCANTQIGVVGGFQFAGGLSTLQDFQAMYPLDSDGMLPVDGGPMGMGGRLYDGEWSFFANVGPGETVLEIWDADLDRADDTDDPNSAGVPAFNNGGAIVAEGASPGAPPDDDASGAIVDPAFRVSPSVFYEVFAPSDRINPAATNANPSGDQEWELYRLGALGVPASDFNLGAAQLEAGPWEVRLQGADFFNLAAFHSETKELFACDHLPLLATTGAMGGFVTGTRSSFEGVAIALEGLAYWDEPVSRRAYTAADGSFSFEGLGAGSYSVWPESDPSQMIERFLRPGERIESLSFDISALEQVAPSLERVLVRSEHEVEATFNEPMGQGALDAFSYTLSGSGAGTLSKNPARVESATGARNASSYLLAWNEGDMVFGGDISITVSGARDLAGNRMGPDNSATHRGGALPVELAMFRLE